MMYKLYIDDNPLEIDLDAALGAMTEQRRRQVLAYKHEQGRKLSASAYMLLCKALREVYGINEPPVFEYSEHGKPSIVGHPEIFFNLSHCRSVAACVVSSAPVGVDVEEVREFKDSLARYVLNDDEYAAVMSSSSPDKEFIRLWTMKESYLKLTGEGITRDLKTVLADTGKYDFDTQEIGSALITVCFSGQLTR
ncbi:MAG: 4'-phosphopantetheinyl transferase family protein [Prevotella sp.]